MNLRDAYNLGHRIGQLLSPYCEKIEVVGSIRRARQVVNDIDICCLAKPGQEEALRARCKMRAAVITEGPKIMTLRLDATVKTPPTQLDIFFAHAGSEDLLTRTPSNWGIIQLIRTGSKEHNIYLAERAKSMGLHLDTQRGLLASDGTIIASETEEEIFKALGLDWIPPVARERMPAAVTEGAQP